MGYDYHITKNRLMRGRAPELTYDEWKRLAEMDPEFERCGDLHWEDKIYDVFAWKSHPDYPSFDFYNGSVRVRHPDEAIFRKMFQIAERLGAFVQGDEGETYRLTDHGIEKFWSAPDPDPPTES